jgi:hypothetical protein
MNMSFQFRDVQQALSFVQQQAQFVEPQIYEIAYPAIQYPTLVPVDTSGNEWAKGIAFYTSDKVGQANWFNHLADDVPFADIQRAKLEQIIEMAAIGYYWTLEEAGQQAMINSATGPTLNLIMERANAARRASEEFLDRIAFFGDTTKNWTGLTNDPNVTIINPPADGTGSSALWANKNGLQIARDINLALSAVYTGSLTTETADTLLLPPDRFTTLAGTVLTNTAVTALTLVTESNAYTALTGNPLTIRTVRGLETAGAGGIARAIAYRNDPNVLKLHLPMPFNFRPVIQATALRFDVPGIFRTGGIEVRRPGAMRYLDGI